MKKIFVLMITTLICATLTNARAGAIKQQPAPSVKPKIVQARKTQTIDPPEKWDFLQFGVWFNTPSATKNSNVYGIKIGAPVCSGRGTVKGIETAVLCGATDNITGLQACILTSVSQQFAGLQFSIVNYAANVDGLQLGIVNIAKHKSFQIGILNYIEDATIPWVPIINFKF